MSANERLTLEWVAKVLEIPGAEAQAIMIERARPKFAEALARAMDDGEISGAEAAELTDVARAGGLSLKEFVSRFFRSEGEAFLRGSFAAAVAHNQLRKDVLERIMANAAALGLSRGEVLEAVRPQAALFIEHLLADAKEDGILSADEDSALREWLTILDIPSDTRAYVEAELSELRLLTDIKNGKPPVIRAPAGLSVQSGELVHFNGPATWYEAKLLKSGLVTSEHRGVLTITDSRLVFSSDTRSESLNFTRIVSLAHPGGRSS